MNALIDATAALRLLAPAEGILLNGRVKMLLRMNSPKRPSFTFCKSSISAFDLGRRKKVAKENSAHDPLDQAAALASGLKDFVFLIV